MEDSKQRALEELTEYYETKIQEMTTKLEQVIDNSCLLSGFLSQCNAIKHISRIWIKKKESHCQYLLCKYNLQEPGDKFWYHAV